MKNEKGEYIQDIWNYLENVGYILFIVGTVLDFILKKPNDSLRIIWVFTVIFILIKLIYLIRVFEQLNFLVTMITNVVEQIGFFIVMFSMYLVTFATCFQIFEVSTTPYGRMNKFLSHFFAVVRCSMGDFSIIDMFEGFDVK